MIYNKSSMLMNNFSEKLNVYADIHGIPVDTQGLEEAIFMEAYSLIQNTIDKIYDMMNEADKSAGSNHLVKNFIKHCVLSRCHDDYFCLTDCDEGERIAIPTTHQSEQLTAIKYGGTEYSVGLILHSMYGSKGAKEIEATLK